MEADYWKKRRIFPIMHVLALRRDVYERDRWIAMNLYKAFEAAKNRSMARVAELGPRTCRCRGCRTTSPSGALAGDDFWPYGIEPNRPTLEAFLQYGYEQGVARRRLKVEELFAPETLERGRSSPALRRRP